MSMKLVMETSGDFKRTLKELNDIVRNEPTEEMKRIGAAGVRALEARTPRNTGETARSWRYEIKRDFRRGMDLNFYNTAHPYEQVNIAVLKEFGHGTGTGGYVPPSPYIKQAMNEVFGTAADRLAKDVIK